MKEFIEIPSCLARDATKQCVFGLMRMLREPE